MTTPIKLGAGAILGSGKQYMPWIHIDDLCAVYIEAIENKLLSGPINAAAPQDISNRDFTIAVAEHLNKTLWLPKVPSFFLTMIFGDMASLFLKGNKVQPNKVLSIKFKFKFPTLNQALFDLLG
jgi:NAD dependent epimerase/dehydratase family enzyme